MLRVIKELLQFLPISPRKEIIDSHSSNVLKDFQINVSLSTSVRTVCERDLVFHTGTGFRWVMLCLLVCYSGEGRRITYKCLTMIKSITCNIKTIWQMKNGLYIYSCNQVSSCYSLLVGEHLKLSRVVSRAMRCDSVQSSQGHLNVVGALSFLSSLMGHLSGTNENKVKTPFNY